MIVAGGRRLEVARIAGDAARPTIVLLHEGLGSVSTWRDFPGRLAASTGCAVLSYSRYGYGNSAPLDAPREPDYMHVEGRDVLPELLAAAGIDRPILFGHSDGASIALIAAAYHPQIARGLIVEAPHVFVEELSIASIAKARDAFATTDVRAKLARHHADPDGAFRGWNDAWLDPRFRDWNITELLPRIVVPVLAIQGEDDAYGTRAQVDALAAAVPRARVVLLDGCGHSPHRERTDVVLAQSAAFVAGLET